MTSKITGKAALTINGVAIAEIEDCYITVNDTPVLEYSGPEPEVVSLEACDICASQPAGVFSVDPYCTCRPPWI